MATYFAVTADDVESSIVHVPTSGASGVVLNSGTIVTVPLPRLADEAVRRTRGVRPETTVDALPAAMPQEDC
jgi:hypothetical protein